MDTAFYIDERGGEISRKDFKKMIRDRVSAGTATKDFWKEVTATSKRKIIVNPNLVDSPPDVWVPDKINVGKKAIKKLLKTLKIRVISLKEMLTLPDLEHNIYVDLEVFDRVFPGVFEHFVRDKNEEINIPFQQVLEYTTNERELIPALLMEANDADELIPVDEDGTITAGTISSLTYDPEFPRLIGLRFGDQRFATGEKMQRPRFYPRYFTVGYRRDLLLWLENSINMMKIPTDFEDEIEHYITAYEDLCDVARNTYFGNGSPSGQLGRYMQVSAVKRATADATKSWWQKNTYLGDKDIHSVFEVAMDYIFPPGEPEFALRTENMFLWPFHKAFKIVPEASPGLGHNSNAHKEDTMEADMFLATEMLMDFAKDSVAALEKWEWCRLCQLKPKGECYEQIQFGISDPVVTSNKDIRNNVINWKTRNYCPFPNNAQLPAQAFFKSVFWNLDHFSSPNWRAKWYDYDKLTVKEQIQFEIGYFNRSLIGWSGWHGGMEYLMEASEFALERLEPSWTGKLLEETGQPANDRYMCVYFVYADNLFGMVHDKKLEQYHWVSMDGTKMEGCISNDQIQWTINHLINKYNEKFGERIDDIHFHAKGGGLALGLEQYLRNLYPLIATEGIGVFYETQVKANMMGSGVIATAYHNNYKDCAVLYELEKNRTLPPMTKDGKPSKWLLECGRKAGVIMKVENVAWDVRNRDKPGVFPLETLGFDGVYFNGALAPILNYQRFKQAFLFQKKGRNKKGFSKMNAIYDRFIDLVRFRTLFLLGGWYYPGFRRILPQLCKDRIRWLHTKLDDKTLKMMIDEIISEYDKLPDDPVNRLLYEQVQDVATFQYDVPSLMSVLELIIPPEETADFYASIIRPTISEHLSEDVLEDIDAAADGFEMDEPGINFFSLIRAILPKKYWLPRYFKLLGLPEGYTDNIFDEFVSMSYELPVAAPTITNTILYMISDALVNEGEKIEFSRGMKKYSMTPTESQFLAEKETDISENLPYNIYKRKQSVAIEDATDEQWDRVEAFWTKLTGSQIYARPYLPEEYRKRKFYTEHSKGLATVLFKQQLANVLRVPRTIIDEYLTDWRVKWELDMLDRELVGETIFNIREAFDTPGIYSLSNIVGIPRFQSAHENNFLVADVT